jgi:hypothetical protein
MKMTLVKKSGGLGRLSARGVSAEETLWFCQTAASKSLWMWLLDERQERQARHGLRRAGRDRRPVRPGRKRRPVDIIPLAVLRSAVGGF